MKKALSFSQKVFRAVTLIPQGKVATYSEISRIIGRPRAYRAVGNILHHNPNSRKIPCHRIVSANGALSRNFAFGGIAGQKEKLEREGVEARENNTVDLKKYAVII